MTALRVEGLYKVFGRRPQEAVARLRDGATAEEVRASGATPAVIDAGFTVQQGEIFVVMGLSGSGKSTLLRMLNGLLEPTAGSVLVGDEEITGLDRRRLREVRQRRMSMVFQHFALLPHRSVAENAAYALEVRGVDRRTRLAAAREALAMVGLEDEADRRPDELSGGMQQRVGLARALASEADLLLMDEAFSALDPLIRREMQDQLLDLQAPAGPDDRLHHPRPQRGHAARRPGRGHAQRPDRPHRDAGGDPRRPGRRVRGPLPGRRRPVAGCSPRPT